MAEKKLMVVVGANITDFQKKMNETTKRLNRMGKDAQKSFGPIMNTIGTGLKVMGTAAATGFAALTVGSVKGASSLEQYRNTLNVVMKDQKKAAETMAWAVDFANKTPFDTSSIVDATVKLQSYGVTAKNVMPQIGDMAAVMGKDLNQAVEAIADAQTGELERLKEFGVTKAMIVEEGNRIMRGKELVNAKGQIVDQENFNKALFSLMEQKFKGGMEIQANSFSGLWSTITGVFSTAISTMAGISATGEVQIGGFFDRLKQKMQVIVDWFTKMTSPTIINDMGKMIQGLSPLEIVGQKVGAAFNKMFDIAEKLVQVGKGIYNNWNLIAPVLAGVVAGFLYFKIATTYVTALDLATKILNMTMAANPIGIVTLALMGLVAAGLLVYKNWDWIKAKAEDLWIGIKTTFGNIKTTISDLWSEAIQWGENVVKGIAQGFVNKTAWIKERVLGFCKKIGQTVKDFFGISSPSKLMAEYGQYVAEGFANGIKDGTKSTAEKATAMATAIKSALDSVLTNTSVTVSIAQAEFEKLKTKMGETANQSVMYQAQVNMLTTQINSQTDAIAFIQKAYADMVAIKGANSTEAENLYLKLIQEQTAYLNLKGSIDEVNKSLKQQLDYTSQLSSKDKSKVSDAANAMAVDASMGGHYEGTGDNATWVSSGNSSGWENMSQSDINDTLKNIKKFDTGGIVPGAVGTPQLIMAHGGETVLPTHKRSMGGSVSIIMHNNISSDYDVERMGEQLVRFLRRKGVLAGA